MSRLVSITVTALVPDDIESNAVGDAIFNTIPIDGFNEAFDCEVELLDFEITLDVEAE